MSETIGHRRTPDAVRLSEIATILTEEGFAETEVLSGDLTFGQARGVAGRKRTQLIRRLRDLGFSVVEPDSVSSAESFPIFVDCDLVWIPPVFFGVKCKIRIGLSSTK